MLTTTSRILIIVLILMAASTPVLCQSPAAQDDIDLDNLSISELIGLRERIALKLNSLGQYPYILLMRNDKGEEVVRLQRRLHETGYYSGRISGRFDNETQIAVKQFEKGNGLEANGEASIEDQVLLFSSGIVARATPTVAPRVDETPAPMPYTQENNPDFSLAEPITGWELHSGFTQSLFVPYIKVQVRNVSGKSRGHVTVRAIFYNMEKKEIWSEEISYLVSTSDTALKDGFSKTAFLYASVGYKNALSSQLLPDITAEIFINDEFFMDVVIQKP